MGGWIKHPKDGLQNGNTKVNANAVNTYSCELSFNLLSAVFGGACEKYIPMSVMEGMQIELQLDNCANVVKYQFEAFPDTGGYNPLANANNLLVATRCPLDAVTGLFDSHLTHTNAANSTLEACRYQHHRYCIRSRILFCI